MKATITTILIFILTLSVHGNDGAYLMRGGVIYPAKESKISLDKEVLSFNVNSNSCHVDILFEFNNPETIERKLMIGFQSPTATGDVDEKLANTNQITDFKIMVDGQLLPYKLKATQCEDCELKDPGEFRFSQGRQGVFVYLFEVTFKPGLNQINHSYSFPASSDVETDQIYNYILTTGAKWAGGKIKDLTVNFNFGQNKYFYVKDIFGKKATWSVIGSGKVTNEQFINHENDTIKMVRILSGSLQIEVKDLQPQKNIEFGIINDNSFSIYSTSEYSSLPTIPESNKIFHALKHQTLDVSFLEEGNLTKEELKILRNTIYAQYGYVFKDKEIQDYFSKFAWYIPNPNLAIEQIILTKEEKKFIDEILKREKE